MYDTWDWREHGGCPRCGRQDHGFDMPDERWSVVVDLLSCLDENVPQDAACDACRTGNKDGCLDPEPVYATCRIVRTWRKCHYCADGTDFDVSWELKVADFTYHLFYEDEAVAIIGTRTKRLSSEKAKRVTAWNDDIAECRAIEAAERRMGA